MKQILLTPILALVAMLSAGDVSEIHADDRGGYTGGGHTVYVDVNPGPYVHNTNVTDGGMTSAWADATPDAGGDSFDIEESAEMTSNGNTYRFYKKKLQYKDANGKWQSMRKTLKTEGQGTLPPKRDKYTLLESGFILYIENRRVA